jgi:site-specific recombinase XerD
MVIEQAINNYLDWKVIRSPRAADIYKSYLRRLMNFRNVDTKDMKNTDIVEFHRFLATKNNPPTVAYSCRILKNFFRYLNSIQECSVNPFLIEGPKYSQKPRVGVTDDEFKAMCATLNPFELHDLQKLTILHMLYNTGVRVSELCELDVNQISPTENHTCIETKKNKRIRVIAWTPDFHQNTLIRWLGSRICLNQKPSLFLSLDKPGRERLTPRTIERWIREITTSAGITKKITPHMFRHAKAHRMKARGADFKDIQMMLGHVSPYSALIYLNYDQNEMLANAQKYI